MHVFVSLLSIVYVCVGGGSVQEKKESNRILFVGGSASRLILFDSSCATDCCFEEISNLIFSKYAP